jgi:putative translation initiation factor eIF-6
VPVHQTNMAGTPMLGAFCAGNSHCLLLPPIALPEELKFLEKLGIKYEVIDTNLTALGNNILCNDHCCIVSPKMEPEAVAQIEAALKVKAVTGTIAGLDNVGSLAAIHSRMGIISIDAEDEELERLEKLLKVRLTKTTLGMGVAYVSSSIILNSHGFVVSDRSSGIEIADADSALGFLD